MDFIGVTASPAIDDQEEEKKPGEEETVREERDKPPTHTGEEGQRSRPLSQELAGAARWGYFEHDAKNARMLQTGRIHAFIYRAARVPNVCGSFSTMRIRSIACLFGFALPCSQF